MPIISHTFMTTTNAITMSSRIVSSTLYRMLNIRGKSVWVQASSAAGVKRAMHSTSLKRKATSATGAIPIVGAASCAQSTPKPTSKQLKTLFVASAVPMIGFGFMDNFIMIQAGSYIDSTLGVSLGLATLTAAAMGQVFSDVSGVVFGGTLERFLHKFKMIRSPGLTEAQRHLTSSRNVAMAGSVVGVIVGCMLGACSLLFLDLEAHERARRAEALYNVVTCMLSDSPDSSIECDACTVYLASAAKDVSPYSTRRDGEAQLKVLQDCNEDSLAVQSGRKRAILKESYSPDGTYLYVPVVKGDELIAVLEFHRNGDESTFTFDEERTAIMMARHMAIFIDNLACD